MTQSKPNEIVVVQIRLVHFGPSELAEFGDNGSDVDTGQLPFRLHDRGPAAGRKIVSTHPRLEIRIPFPTSTPLTGRQRFRDVRPILMIPEFLAIVFPGPDPTDHAEFIEPVCPRDPLGFLQ